MAVAAEHLVPELFPRERVLAYQETLELGDDDARRFRVDGTIAAFQPLVGLDLEIVRADRAQLQMSGASFVIRLGPVFVINVEHVDLRLVIGAHQFLNMAFDPPDLNGGDLERALGALPHSLAGFARLRGALWHGAQHRRPGKSGCGSCSRAYLAEKGAPFHGVK